MNTSKAKFSKVAKMDRIPTRTGKIARLPCDIRQQLNERLRDGEKGASLLAWLNHLPAAKAVLKEDFDGRPVNLQNLCEWRKGGYREWLVKQETDELFRQITEETEAPKASRHRRKQSGSEVRDVECETDRLSRWFFRHYIVSARARLGAARNDLERWNISRVICADLNAQRRADHHVERRRIWREKAEADNGVTEEQFIEWARVHKEILRKIWPDEFLTPEEREAAVKKIFGVGDDDPPQKYDAEPAKPAETMAEAAPVITELEAPVASEAIVPEPPPEEFLDEPEWVRPRRSLHAWKKQLGETGDSNQVKPNQGNSSLP